MQEIKEVQSDWVKVFGTGAETTLITRDFEDGQEVINVRLTLTPAPDAVGLSGLSLCETHSWTNDVDVKAKFNEIDSEIARYLRDHLLAHSALIPIANRMKLSMGSPMGAPNCSFSGG